MEGLFPTGTGISRVRGIISIIKQNKGHIGISELAEESDEDIDDLLPIIDACKLLGLAVVDGSKIKLTDKGEKLTVSNFSKYIGEGLAKTEPFKSAIKIIDDGSISSRELLDALKSRGIMIHEESTTNDILLKKLLVRWGVRTKLMNYDQETDTWSVKRQ
ncbi:MAG: AAA-associated domain-containing protein [Candidatus Micrarchaeota archaeon]|nr:AAA-associated domain-containing protein [Candidatus Micrarchaeota archaeon]